MSYYSPQVIVDPLRGQPVGLQPAVQPAGNQSLLAVPSPMVVQQQIPQYVPTTTTAPIPIPANRSAQPVSYPQQPHYAAQPFPVYAQQPQPAGYPMSSHTYGTPATTQYVPRSVGGSYMFVDERSPRPHRHHHHHSPGHRHLCGHRHRHGHHYFSHRRDRAYSDPERDYRYRRR